MKHILSFFVLLILASCVTAPIAETPTSIPSVTVLPTNTALPPTSVPSVTPLLTSTPETPCDPFSVDFCITEGHFLLQRPIHLPANDLIDPIYGYGSTANGTREPHHGVEFSNPSGTPVYAAAEGKVIFAGPDEKAVYAPWSDFYGNLVVIEHEGGLFTLYAHLSSIDVQVNQKIFAADKIGEVGRTGGAVGSHLHFEVRRGAVEDYFSTQNPELWLVPVKDENGSLSGTLMISLVDGNGNLIQKANFTIGYYSDPSQPAARVYYATPYSPDLLNGKENAVLGGLSAGHYRIAVEMNGQILERWTEVESGKLTQVVFVVK
jgi:murein DD-endopeptidase MepM/ murein hydrolase activator NlpD